MSFSGHAPACSLQYMDKGLVTWLNGKRNFTEGVELYKRLIGKTDVIQFLQQGHNRVTAERLFNELRAEYYRLKQKKIPEPVIVTEPPRAQVSDHESDLAKSCKLAADKLFKEVMNLRARLFHLCSIDPQAGENNSDTVYLREVIVLELMDLIPEMSIKYEDYRYVLQHGSLPVQKPPVKDELPMNPILLERMRVNLMTNIAKLKKKEQTPERVSLLQNHEAKLNLVKQKLLEHK